MTEVEILLMEICRIALEDEHMFQHIGHELDLCDDELNKIKNYVALEESK